MPTWKQEVAEATTPIEGVNDVTATLAWNIAVIDDPFSPLPQTGGTVRISRTVQIKGMKNVDARLVDGKNYMAEDFITEISYLKYLSARMPSPDDPQIINNGKIKSLDDMRPLTDNYGIQPISDTLTIAGKVWAIADISGIGILNDESTREPVPAKLRFTLRGM